MIQRFGEQLTDLFSGVLSVTFGACIHAPNMGTMIQIRKSRIRSIAGSSRVPRLAGMSLSDYLLSEIRQVAERPTLDELRARLRSRTETSPSVPPAEAVRAQRDRA